MGVVNFYHLNRGTVDETVITLCSRALAQGWRVMVRGQDRAALVALDDRLWLTPEDGFLPHALEGGQADALQPVLLGTGPAGNGANALLLLGAVPVEDAESRALDRTWLLFEAADDSQVTAARAEWRRVTQMGLEAAYWSDASGKWEKKAESKSPPAGA